MQDELLYADDLAKNAKSETTMQGGMDRISQACDNFDLTISTKKIEVVHQPAPGKPYSEPTITVNGHKLQVDKFTYLGSTLSRAVHIDDEVTARTTKARAESLQGCQTSYTHARLGQCTNVMPSQRLNHFRLSCLRSLLKIRCQDKIPDTEVLKKAYKLY